jgi:hypothetical protein
MHASRQHNCFVIGHAVTTHCNGEGADAARSEFLEVFNRLYVCRRFPTSWHHLTLHCGWQGTSAGGPTTQPQAHAVPTEEGAPGETMVQGTEGASQYVA